MKALNLILFSRPIDIGHKLLIVGSGLRFIVPQKMLKQTYKRTFQKVGSLKTEIKTILNW